jgi:opacity protein-like surface antigen
MIRKFVMVLACAVGFGPAGTTLFAQQTPAVPPPAGQQPAAQPPADQQPATPEATDEDTIGQRKKHVHDYNNWTFSVGAGSSLPHSTTKTFVKGGGTVVQGAVARNANKYFGLRLDFTWVNLPLRNSALQLAQASGGNNHAYDLSLDPIVNVPLTKRYGVYFVVGPSFIRRSGKIDSSNVVPGTPCNAFWTYWGTCFNNSVPLNKDFLSERVNEFGYNVGGGVTRKFGEDRHEVYAEVRLLHGSHNNNTTDVRALTVGLRW